MCAHFVAPHIIGLPTLRAIESNFEDTSSEAGGIYLPYPSGGISVTDFLDWRNQGRDNLSVSGWAVNARLRQIDPNSFASALSPNLYQVYSFTVDQIFQPI